MLDVSLEYAQGDKQKHTVLLLAYIMRRRGREQVKVGPSAAAAAAVGAWQAGSKLALLMVSLHKVLVVLTHAATSWHLVCSAPSVCCQLIGILTWQPQQL
jgi:hypothetical protein